MSLAALIQVLLRHWAATGAILVISASTGVGFWVSVQPEFEAEAVVMVLPSGSSGSDEVQNPLDQLASRSNNIVATVISFNVNSDRWRTTMKEEGLESQYLIDPGDGTTPTIALRVVSDEQDRAQASRDRLVEALSEELLALQSELGATEEGRYVVYPLTADPARPLYGSRDRLVVGTVLLGLLASIGLALMLDSLARSRGRTRERRGDFGSTASQG